MHEIDKSFGPLDAGAMQVAYDLLRNDAGKSPGYETFPTDNIEAKAELIVKLGHALAEKWRRRR
jgi:hypothetical protein